MAVIDTDKVVTVTQLVEELGVSIPTARGIVQDLSEVATINRTSFYDRDDVKAELFSRNERMLTFMGVRPPHESYDTNITAALEVAEDEQ
jgi:hypothetical protein